MNPIDVSGQKTGGIKMRRIHYKDGSYKDVKNNQSWEYENDPNWKETEDLEPTNKCEDGIGEGKTER